MSNQHEGTEMCVGGVTQTGVCFEHLEIPSATPRHTISTPMPLKHPDSHIYTINYLIHPYF